MPYSGHYEQNYEQFFKGAIQNAGLDPVLAAHLSGPRIIVEDIWEQTKNAFVVLADMTGKNPNVFYEIGLAHALGKPVVLVIDQKEKRPFDIQHLRVITYDTRKGDWGINLKQEITSSLMSVLADPNSARGYIFSEPPKPQLSASFQDYVAQFPLAFDNEDALLARSELSEIRETLGNKSVPFIRYLRGGNVEGAHTYLTSCGLSQIRRDHLVETAIRALTYLSSVLPGMTTAQQRRLSIASFPRGPGQVFLAGTPNVKLPRRQQSVGTTRKARALKGGTKV
jgi:hypothetical protein